MWLSQCPVTRAHPSNPKNMTAIPAATVQAGTCRFGTIALKLSASFAGHTATHSMHAMHSADLIVTSLSTGNADGHAFAHFLQSMHALSTRLIRTGLSNAARPISAP